MFNSNQNKHMDILTNIQSSGNHINNLKSQVLTAKKIQLHTGMEGFNSPKSFGIYKNTGGDALGIVGDVFEPMNLQLFLDAIEHSVLSSNADVDLNKLTYHEYYGGGKVVFRLPLKKYEIKTPMVGDTLETALEFRTGFDGMTKISLGFYALRLWCTNGAKNWQKDVAISMKNTTKNQAKVMTFTDEIFKVISMTENYVNCLNDATLKQITQSDIDKFLTKLTGYDVKAYSDLTTRSRNILDSVNNSIAIEMQNTGNNAFSLLQGITRYTTHELAKGNIEKLLYASASEMNAKAHELIFATN
jgi:hypothetical protein